MHFQYLLKQWISTDAVYVWLTSLSFLEKDVLLPEGYFNQYCVTVLKAYSCVLCCHYFKSIVDCLCPVWTECTFHKCWHHFELIGLILKNKLILNSQIHLFWAAAHALIKVCNVLKMFLKHLLRSTKKNKSINILIIRNYLSCYMWRGVFNDIWSVLLKMVFSKLE